MGRFLLNSMMKMTNLNKDDFTLLENRGIDPGEIDKQLQRFRQGAAPVKLAKPATIGDGITRFSQAEEQEMVSLFSKEAGSLTVVKFVPASGAASRMFHVLQTYYNTGDMGSDTSGGDFDFLQEFIAGIKERKFAFFNDLHEVLAKEGHDIDELVEKEDYRRVIDYLLNPKGLNYANLPKALLKFHRCEDGARTSLEEHLVEGIAYAKDENKVVHIHLTISPEFEEKTREFVAGVKSKYEADGTTFDISYSQQKPSTDTIAVDENNNLFRDGENHLVLRPGGHGALIGNVAALAGDIIFIKNH